MFDLFRSRDKAVRILLGFILVVVAASMVTYLIPGQTPGTTIADETVLAEIGGRKLTQQEFQRHFTALVQGYGNLTQDQVALMFPTYMTQEIQKMSLLYVAKELGLTVPDDQVVTGLQAQWPQFFVNGQLKRDEFTQYLAAIGITEEDATDLIRDQLTMKLLDSATLAGIVVTDADLKSEFARRYDKAKISYIGFPATKFIDQVKPTDDDLRKAFEFSKDNYPVPAKSNYQIVVVDQEKVAAGMTLTDAELHRAYSESMDNFRSPERVHVRHILISTDGKSDSEKKALKAKADDLLKQLKSGADFAELAKKNSDDKGSAEKGGDLDWIVKGQMQVPEFENAAFSLKPNEISGVISSSLGYHIIQVLGKEAATVKPFDQVKADLAEELKKEKLGDKVQQMADQIHAALLKNPGSAEDVAKQFGALLIVVPEGVAGQPVPSIGVSQDIDTALAQMKPNDVSPEISLPGDKIGLIVLKSRTPARSATFEEVREQVRQNYLLEQSGKLAAVKAQEAADRLKKGEDMAAVAKSMKLDVVTSNLFGGADAVEGLGQAVYVADAFTKPVGSILGPTMINNREVVSKVVDQVRGDPSLFAAQRPQMVDELKRNKAKVQANLLNDSVVTELLRSGKLKRNDKAINDLYATYAPH